MRAQTRPLVRDWPRKDGIGGLDSCSLDSALQQIWAVMAGSRLSRHSLSGGGTISSPSKLPQ